MKKKLLFIIFIIMLCAGCKSNYTMTINEDGSVEEKVYLSETSEFYERYSKSSTGRVIGFILEPYSDTLNKNGYSVENSISSEESGVIIKKKHKTIDDYVKDNVFYKQYSDKIDFKRDGKKVSLSIKGYLSASDQDQSRIPVQNGYIAIKVPFKVVENNADKVDGDTYIWDFTNNNGKEREIKIVYDSSKLAKSTDYKMVFIFLGIILGILVIGFIVYNKMSAMRKESNRL